MAGKVAIFDFDGTLADTAVIIRSIYGGLSVERGWPELTDDAYANLRKGTLRQAARWVGVRPWQMPFLFRHGRKLMREEAKHVKLFPGIPELIKELKQADIPIYILSRNSEHLVREVLTRYELQNDMIILPRALFRSKSVALNRLVFQEKYKRSRMYMIGDELRDIEAGRIAGVQTIAVTWGLQDESLLKAANPSHVAYDVSDIKDFLI